MNQVVESFPALGVLLDSPAAQRVTWVLLHFLWQGAAVGLVAGIALRGLRSDAARLRGVVASLALVVLAALPPATLLRTTAMSDAAPEAGLQATAAGGPQDVISRTARPDPQLTSSRGIWSDLSRLIPDLRQVRPWVLSLWLFGVVAGSAAWIGSWLSLRRLVRGARPAGRSGWKRRKWPRAWSG